MVKKCCITGCKSNYDNKKNETIKRIPAFRFPKDPSQKRCWEEAIPFSNLKINLNSVICERHWPAKYRKKICYGKVRPDEPPSVWKNVLAQEPIPSTSTGHDIKKSVRPTKIASSDMRSVQNDELDLFLENDKASYSDLCQQLIPNTRAFLAPIITFMVGTVIFLQSILYFNGVPAFLVKIYDNLKYETFHKGVKCYVKTLSSNRINALNSWSKLEEIVRYLHLLPSDHKTDIIQQQISAQAPKRIGYFLYDTDIITRAFEYFATSRALYTKLRRDYQLPSISTLTRITSKVSKLNDSKFLDTVFKAIAENKRMCIILHDEVYVKQMLLYHGGAVFGRAADDTSSLAKTMLGIKIVCLLGGPSFLNKMIPVAKLNTKFLYEQLQITEENIEKAGGSVKAIISDGNRVNSACFQKYATLPEKPWVTDAGVFLLYDFVHLLKNIRNLWLTEKSGELVFEDKGVLRTAKWAVLQNLYYYEIESNVKMSDLTEEAVAPKPIERQKVSTCLKVFSERTYHAIVNHSRLDSYKVDTAIFLQIVINWWKILNVKSSNRSV